MHVVVIAATAALGGLLFGHATGVISGALLFPGKAFHLSHLMLGVVPASHLRVPPRRGCLQTAWAGVLSCSSRLSSSCSARRRQPWRATLPCFLPTVLDTLFWADLRTVRYGAGEVLHGIKAIHTFRNSRPVHGFTRTLRDMVTANFGREFATASTPFTRRNATGILGRQQQSLMRLPQGWRIVAAQVSLTPAAGS